MSIYRRVDATFVGPVFVDATVEVSGRVEDVFDRDGTTCARGRLMCQASERQILAGFAVLLIDSGRS